VSKDKKTDAILEKLIESNTYCVMVNMFLAERGLMGELSEWLTEKSASMPRQYMDGE